MKTPTLLLTLASLALASLSAHAAGPVNTVEDALNEQPVVLPTREVRVDRLDSVQKDVRDQLSQLRAIARHPAPAAIAQPAPKLLRGELPSTPAPTAPATVPVVVAGV